MTAAHPQADGATRAMSAAIRQSGLTTDDIDYISAHGTSTPFNDARETKAVKQVFGSHISKLAVSSIKSMIGHTLGASGALATIATIMALRDHSLPPTINYEHSDPECDLDYIPNTTRRTAARTALVNAFGFGGTNAVLALRGVSA